MFATLMKKIAKLMYNFAKILQNWLGFREDQQFYFRKIQNYFAEMSCFREIFKTLFRSHLAGKL